MSREQGVEVAENYASRLYEILYKNNFNNQHFQYLIKNIEEIKRNEELIKSYKTVLNISGLDDATRLNHVAEITKLQQVNEMIITNITNNHEMLRTLNQSIAIDNSVILQELDKLRKGGGGGGISNQFINSIDRL